MAILAVGKVGLYQFTLGVASYFTVLLMYIFAKFFGVIGIGYAIIVNAMTLSLIRVHFAHYIVGVGLCYWVFKIVIPISIVIVLSFVFGGIIVHIFPQSFTRICLTTVVVIFILMISSAFIVFDGGERHFVLNIIMRPKNRLLRLISGKR